jgi:glycerol-3-phosphate dehydrogenase
MMGIGLNMYDVMATTRVGLGRRERAERVQGEDYWAPDRHRAIQADEVVELIPALATRDPKGAYLFYDCQTDDVRLVLTILGEAERYGAVSLNGTAVTGLIDRSGRADGVLCRDVESGEEFEIEADNVINATGVWADRIRPEEILEEEEVPRIAPSRGTHALVPSDLLPLNRAACIVPAGEDRTIFALPWFGRTLIGTTDNDYEGDLAHVKPSSDDIEYLLNAANSFFGLKLGPSDLVGAYAGVRPLISAGDPRKSVDISRKAELYETSSGLLTITGGKLTTWRRMAKLVVDRMVEREGREAACRTDDIPLGLEAGEGDLDPPEGVAEDDLPAGYRDLLGFRYGHAGRAVLRVAGGSPELAAPIVEGQPDLLAEAVIAARLEQARSVADVLLRRTRLGLLAAPQLRTAEAVLPVAEAMAAELGWDADRVRREADAWVEEARAEGIDPAGVTR